MTTTIEDRFFGTIAEDPVGGCWLWEGSLNNRGYSNFHPGGHVSGHRFAYVTFVGPIPDGMQIDHLCRVRRCVNPDHLELVTPSENTKRGLTPSIVGGRMTEKTHCPAGHEYDGSNLLVQADGKRRCRTCRRDQQRAYRDRRRGEG